MDEDKKRVLEIKKTAPLFIVGCQRSGTSFLYRALGGVLDIGFGRDNTFFINFYKIVGKYGDLSNDINLSKMLEDFERAPTYKNRFKGLKINNDFFISCVEKRDFFDVVRTIYAFWAFNKGNTRWGGKTPDYVGHIEMLVKFFPDVKIINIVRDGRDVTLSLFERPWGPKDIYVAALYWKKRVLYGLSGKKLGDNKFFEFKYEGFLEFPEKYFRDILKFLEYDKKDYESYCKKFNDIVVPKMRRNNSFKWKTKLKESDILIFESVAGKLLKDYGYDIINENFHEYRLSFISKGGHYLNNFFVKGIKGHIFRTIWYRSDHYKF